MYKVLVADDEPMHRKGIVVLIGKLRPEYTLFEANDGEEALRIINSSEIDIVITDIKMPSMDGLEMIEALGSRIRELKVVILSAYGFFDYAKKALTLGAFDYILKPVEESDVEQTLFKLEDSLANERKSMEEKINMEQTLRATLPAYREQLFTRWAEGNLTNAETEEIRKLIPEHSHFLVGVFELHNAADREQVLPLRLENDLRTIAAPICFFPDGTRKWLVSILFFSKAADNDAVNGLYKTITSSLERINEECGIRVTAGTSDPFNRVFADIKEAYRQAAQALVYKFYFDTLRLIPYSAVRMNPERTIFYEEEEALHEAMINLDRNKLSEGIDHLFSNLMQKGFQPPNRMIDSMYHLVINRLNRLDQLLLKEQIGNIAASAETQLWNCKHWSELKDKVKGLLSSAIDQIESRRNNKNSEIIQNCKRYIEERYMDDISLDSVARLFYFSPAYFSSFFKNYTGIGFTEFILQTRMRIAKELLSSTDDKVSEISSKVGYKDPSYFTKLFKRETGYSPEEFRRNLGSRKTAGRQP